MLLSLILFSAGGGIAVTLLGYYTPFVLASSVLMSIGAGLLSTFTVNTGIGKWIGYQVLFGAGVGNGMQNGLIMAQTVLPKRDIPTGTAMIMFSQTLGGAVFISVGQNVFTNRLLANIKQVLPDFNPGLVLGTGATSLKNVIPAGDLPSVLVAYNDAIVKTFYVAVAMATVSIFGSALFGWRSVKGKKIEMAGGA